MNDKHQVALTGILAWQLELISLNQLRAAAKQWELENSIPLDQILADQQALASEQQHLLNELASGLLALHDGDARQCLSSLGCGDQFSEAWSTVDDANIEATLSLIDEQTRPITSGSHDRTPISRGSTRFEILHAHARGGLGEVFVAKDLELNREVALKEIRTEYADDANCRARFESEAVITGKLEHPGIVPVYGKGNYVDGRPYYAMRFIHGDSLKQAIDQFHGKDKDDPSTPPDYRTVAFRQLLGRFVDVCNAIEYAHSHGVLHRDLKPDNVMLGSYGETLVVDWGLAKEECERQPDRNVTAETDDADDDRSTSTTRYGAAVGTPAYMSPEQAAGRIDELGPASDVYSLGATLYYLLVGQSPFHGHPLTETLRRVQQGEFDAPRRQRPTLPKPLEGICLRAMESSSSRRYPSAAELAADIESWLADEPVSAYRETQVERSARLMRRHKSWTMAATATLLVITLTSLMSVLLINQSRIEEQKAKQETVRSLASEQSAKRRAMSRFELAMNAVASFYQGVSEDALLRQPELEDLRNGLLGSAAGFYRQLAAEMHDANHPEEKAALAHAHLNLARVNDEVGSSEDALAGCESAIELYSQLIADSPDVDEYSEGLAQGHAYLSALLFEHADVAGARASLLSAIDISEGLVAREPTDESYQRGLAVRLSDLASLYADIGESSRARQLYQRAVPILEDIAQRNPNNVSDQKDLAAIYTSYGTFQNVTGEFAGAEELLGKAIHVRKTLIDQGAGDRDTLTGLAIAHNNLGLFHRDTGELASAKAQLGQSIAAYDELVAKNPAVREYRHRLAAALINLASLQRETGDIASAEPGYQQAIAAEERLVADHPDAGKYQDMLATAHLGMGETKLASGEPVAALDYFERAATAYEKLVDQNPDLSGYRRSLAGSHYSVGNALYADGKMVEAVQAYNRSIDCHRELIEEEAEILEYRDALANTLGNLGNVLRRMGETDAARQSFEESIDIAEELFQLNPEAVEPAIGLGGSYCNLGNMLRDEHELQQAITRYDRALEILSPLVREQQVQRLTDNAVAILRELLAADFFGDQEKIDQLESNPDLDFLRDQDAFVQLMGDLIDQD